MFFKFLKSILFWFSNTNMEGTIDLCFYKVNDTMPLSGSNTSMAVQLLHGNYQNS